MIAGPFDTARLKTCTAIGRLKCSVLCVPLLDYHERIGRSKTRTHAPLASTRWCRTLRCALQSIVPSRASVLPIHVALTDLNAGHAAASSVQGSGPRLPFVCLRTISRKELNGQSDADGECLQPCGAEGMV